jgi:hypothetical protein
MGAAMGNLRAFFRNHRQAAAVLFALALAMKALLPTGYMIQSQADTLTISVCSDASGEHSVKQIVIPQSGKSAGNAAEHGKGEGTCPYSALGMASLAQTNAGLLAMALAFILALGFAPVRAPRPKRVLYLLPPLRGPPAFA